MLNIREKKNSLHTVFHTCGYPKLLPPGVNFNLIPLRSDFIKTVRDFNKFWDFPGDCHLAAREIFFFHLDGGFPT